MEGRDEILGTCRACVAWLGDYVGDLEEQQQLASRPCRAAPAGWLRQALDRAVEAHPGAPKKAIERFVEENGKTYGKSRCADALFSLLKACLQRLTQPALPFEFCVEIVQGSELIDAAMADRSHMGIQLSQDLVHKVVDTLRREHSNEDIKQTIISLGQLFALLCTISQSSDMKSDAHNLFLYFLPSICESRSPNQVFRDQKVLQDMLKQRNKALRAGKSPSRTRLELCIFYGHRIWGFMKSISDRMDEIIDALRAFPFSQGEVQHPHFHKRKRDVLAKIFKPRTWFPHHHHHSGHPHPHPHRQYHQQKLPRRQKGDTSRKQSEPNVQYSACDTSAFQVDSKLAGMTPARVPSIRLNMTSSKAQELLETPEQAQE